MFRRDARNKVRQMGGIMASSEPLVQEVAKFQFGGNVDILSEIQRMRPDIRSAFIRSLGNPPKRTGVRSQTIFSDQDPIYSSLVNGRELNLPRVRPGDPGSKEFRGGILAGEAQNTVERQQLDKIINNANQLGLLEAPTLNKTDLENFIKNQTGDDGFKLTSQLWNSLSEDKSPSMSNLEKVAKEIFKYTSTPSVAAIDLMGGAVNYLRQMPSGTADKILSGQIKLPTGVDFVSLALASGKSLEELQALGVPATQMAAIKEARDKGLGIETKVKIKDDVAEKEALEAEQIAVREAEKPKAIAGGMPLSNQVGTTDVKALQDQLSGGRISSEAPQTLGVTADQGAYAKDKKSTEDFRNGQKSLGDIKNDVQNTVKNGVGVGGSMQQLVDEFTGSVEKHKGLDRGLAIAKIGFAMAAGESPNAITNIAKALSDGADMLIKDKADKDAWDRQVNLAAVQYAATEVTKQRAEGRAIARDRLKSKTMTFGPNGGVYRGKEYGAYEDVEVLQGDIQDNNVPTGIVSTSTITALGAKSKGYTALMKDLVKQKVIGETQGAKDQEDYANFTSTAIKAERGQAVVNNVLLAINDPDGPGITGLVPAAQTAYQKLRSAAGLPTEITSLDQARTHMRQLLQDIVPVTLAAYQGANSISNRDIDLLITAYFGDNALESGGFQFVLQTDAALTQRLQGAAIAMRESQSAAFSGMRAIENRVSSLYKRGSVTLDPNTGNITGDPASGLFAASRERLDKAGLGFPDLPTVGSNIPFFRDENGLIQMKPKS
jgi:hypothetical protein